jgi:protein SCO1/2
LNLPERSLRAVSVLGAFLCGLVLVFGAILFVTSHPSSTGPALAAVGGPFHLVDQDGKAVSDEDMKGRPFLVFFGFTHCPDVCPTTLFDMSQMLHALGPDAGRIGVLFITVDPERDTPAVLKDYLSNFDPHLRGLTGDPAAVNAALKAFRVYAKKVPLESGARTISASRPLSNESKHTDLYGGVDIASALPVKAALR